MKVKRSKLTRMVKEAIVSRLKELAEAKPDVLSADDDSESKEKRAEKGKDAPKKQAPVQDDPDNSADQPKHRGPGRPPLDGSNPPGPNSKSAKVQASTPEMPPGDDAADDELEKDAENPEEGGDEEGDEDAADAAETPTKVGDELVGKTIQSITMEPKSKVLPGAVEINVTFDQVQDTFKIFVTKSGQVKFFWKGLHNTL